jgi:hypothetical protein
MRWSSQFRLFFSAVLLMILILRLTNLLAVTGGKHSIGSNQCTTTPISNCDKEGITSPCSIVSIHNQFPVVQLWKRWKMRMRNSTLHSPTARNSSFYFFMLVRTGAIFPSDAFVFPNQTKARRAQDQDRKKGLAILQLLQCEPEMSADWPIWCRRSF